MEVNPGYVNDSVLTPLLERVRTTMRTATAQAAAEVDRLTIVLNVYYQPYEKSTVGYSVSIDRPIPITGRKEYEESVQVSEKPTELPLGPYHKHPSGMILIENRTGRNHRVRPSIQQARSEEDAYIILSRGDGTIIAFIRKGLPFFGEIPDPQDVVLQTPVGNAEARVVVFPQG